MPGLGLAQRAAAQRRKRGLSPSTPISPVTLDRTSSMAERKWEARGHLVGEQGVAGRAPVVRSSPNRRPGIPDVGRLLPAPLDPGAGGCGQAPPAGFRYGFGADLAGAWLMLRADGGRPSRQRPRRCPELHARALRAGQASLRRAADPARAAALEIDWWRAHRERQYSADPAGQNDELLESLIALYSYLFGENEAAVRPAAIYRVQAMDLSDQWVREGSHRQPAAFVRACRAGPRVRRAARRRPPRGALTRARPA